MDRVKFIDHKEQKILHIDLSDCSVERALEIIAEGKRIIKEQTERSVLALTNFNNDNAFLPDLFQAMKDFAQHNKPYVKASAIIVYKDIHKVLHYTYTKILKASLSCHLRLINIPKV